jgi:putative protease
MDRKQVGIVTHYFTKLGVAVVKLSDELSLEDKITIDGATTSFEQEVVSMQIENENVESAGIGQSIGLKVEERVREGDLVYKLSS